MGDLADIFKEYEGKSVDSLDRKSVRRNLIHHIIKVISSNLVRNDYELNLSLIEEFTRYRFINEIIIHNESFVINYVDDDQVQNVVKISVVPNSLKSKLCNDFGMLDFSGECHNVTFRYLELNPECRLSAVTSLCENMDNCLYFHSYLFDKSSNKIIDLARNLIMDKSDYDKLFCYKEINVLDYSQILLFLKNNSFFEDYNFCHLLFLALVELNNEKDNKYKKKKIFFGNFLRN